MQKMENIVQRSNIHGTLVVRNLEINSSVKFHNKWMEIISIFNSKQTIESCINSL